MRLGCGSSTSAEPHLLFSPLGSSHPDNPRLHAFFIWADSRVFAGTILASAPCLILRLMPSVSFVTPRLDLHLGV